MHRPIHEPGNIWTRRTLLGASMASLAGCAASAPLNALYAPPSGPSPVERHGRLRALGNRIVGDDNQPVVLRGMSLFWSQWIGKYYNAAAINWLRQDWGVNVVRAAIAPYPNGWVDHPDVEMAKAQAVIEAARALGIYVIVDWHAHYPAPEQAANFFTQIAERYGDYPGLIYETFNEPLPQFGWDDVCKPYHERVTAAIRAKDPDNLIVAGSPTWSQDVDIAAVNPLDDANLAYTLHFYAGTHKQALRDKAMAALERDKALFVTEYGVVNADGNGPIDVAETEVWWNFMEEHKISYACWSISDKQESSAALKPGASPEGGWSDDMISPSGLMVRARIRDKNARDL